MRKRPPSPCTNSPSYWDPDILQGAQYKRATNVELYDGQYTKDPVMSGPSLDLTGV